MRILKVWDSEYPWDVRVEKVCRALSEGGHEVHLVACNRNRAVTREDFETCTVHRIPPWTALGTKLDSATQFPAFFNPRWLGLIERIGRQENVGLVLCRDVPLAPAAIYNARRLGVPMVLDMAENYPAMIRDLWSTGETKAGDWLVRNPRAVEAVERWTIKRADHIVVVVEESRDRLVELGVSPDRITVVSNTPSVQRLDRFAFPRPAKAADEPLNMVYLGLLEKARGVGTAIDAAAICKDRGVPVNITLIGDGRAKSAFEAQVDAQGLNDIVQFLGFLPYEEALEIVANSDIGLIPHIAYESWNTTIPNKLFDYMAAGLTVLASDALPTRRVIEETNSGAWFRSGDAEHMADRLQAFWEEGDLDLYGAAGRAAIRERFNWELEGARFSDALVELVAEDLDSVASGTGP